jgi:hypothetical protein
VFGNIKRDNNNNKYEPFRSGEEVECLWVREEKAKNGKIILKY